MSRTKKPERGAKGENNRMICFCGCGKEVWPPRRNWFNKECVERYSLEHDQGFMRRKVWERDKGKCAKCGNTDARRRRGEWQADHIIEVVRGGSPLGLNNLQTLCTECHKEKTAKLAKELAQERARKRIAHELKSQPVLFPDLFAGV